jgi:hypothetical protein
MAKKISGGCIVTLGMGGGGFMGPAGIQSILTRVMTDVAPAKLAQGVDNENKTALLCSQI